MTTIKLDARLRDQLNAEARRRGTTAGSVVEQLWESWLREKRFAAIRDAMARTSATDLVSYADEVEAFDVTLDDGHAPA